MKGRWTEEEDARLREEYGIRTAQQIGVSLDRTAGAVYKRASGLGLKALRTRGRLWTEADDRKLWWMWGTFSPALISKKTGRTQTACLQRAKQLGMGGMQQTTKPVGTVARETGYGEDRILSAARYLGIKIRAGGRTDREAKSRKHRTAYRHTALTEEQESTILEFLKGFPDGQNITDTRWGRKGRPERCLGCQRTDRKHKSRGLCGACYARKRRYV